MLKLYLKIIEETMVKFGMEQMINTPAGEVLITISANVSKETIDEHVSKDFVKFRYLQKLPFFLINALTNIDLPPLDRQAQPPRDLK